MKTRQRALWLILFLALVQGLLGIYNFAFVGQDFLHHLFKILQFERGFSWHDTNPIGYYWLAFHLGQFSEKLLSLKIPLEAISLTTLVLNLCVIFWIDKFFQRILNDPWLSLSVTTFLVFLPFRNLHSLIISSDALTIPIFFSLVLLCLRAFHKKTQLGHWKNIWIQIGALMILAILTKYTFVTLFPALLLIGFLSQRHLQFKAKRWWFCVLCLLPSFLIYSLEMRWSVKESHGTFHTHFGDSAVDSSFHITDLFLPKAKDIELFTEANFLNGRILEAHRYSYFALLHAAIFSDFMHTRRILENQPVREWGNYKPETLPPKNVSNAKNLIQKISIWMSLPISLGIFYLFLNFLFSRCQTLLKKIRYLTNEPTQTILTLLSFSYFLPIFFSLLFVKRAYEYAYWTPRLVMPALIGFMILALNSKTMQELLKSTSFRRTLMYYFFGLSVLYFAIGI